MSSAVVACGGGKFLPEPLLLRCRDSPWVCWLPRWIVPQSVLVLHHRGVRMLMAIVSRNQVMQINFLQALSYLDAEKRCMLE